MRTLSDSTWLLLSQQSHGAIAAHLQQRALRLLVQEESFGRVSNNVAGKDKLLVSTVRRPVPVAVSGGRHLRAKHPLDFRGKAPGLFAHTQPSRLRLGVVPKF